MPMMRICSSSAQCKGNAHDEDLLIQCTMQALIMMVMEFHTRACVNVKEMPPLSPRGCGTDFVSVNQPTHPVRSVRHVHDGNEGNPHHGKEAVRADHGQPNDGEAAGTKCTDMLMESQHPRLLKPVEEAVRADDGQSNDGETARGSDGE
eukprot:1150408-Pelagomonas_calceolata.AAC.1